MITEKAKMLAGELYLASDPELVAMRQRARRLIRLFNASTEMDVEPRTRILRELLGTCGDRIEIEPTLRVDYGSNIHLGNGVFMNFGCVILDCALVTIGDGTMFGPGVHLYTATHPTDAATRREMLEYAKPITIGRDCWIGGGAIVLPGVSIGDEAVVGAGSVVTKDVAPGSRVMGNPARVK